MIDSSASAYCLNAAVPVMFAGAAPPAVLITYAMPANVPPAPNSAPLNEAEQPHAPQPY
jgi:hypothetical protein